MRAAQSAREAALAARDRALVKHCPDLSQVQARVDVAELTIRALEVEAARVAQDTRFFRALHNTSSSHSVRGSVVSSASSGAAGDVIATREALAALDADIAFALNAHQRASKRLKQALAALSDAAASLFGTVRECSDAGRRAHRGRVRTGMADPDACTTESSPKYVLSGLFVDDASGKARPSVPLDKCGTSMDVLTQAALMRKLREADKELRTLSGAPSASLLVDTKSADAARPASPVAKVSNLALSLDGFASSDQHAQSPKDSPRRAHVALPETCEESDEVLSYATDSSMSGPPSPCGGLPFFDDLPDLGERPESPPTSPVSDDSWSHTSCSLRGKEWATSQCYLSSPSSSLLSAPSSVLRGNSGSSSSVTRVAHRLAAVPGPSGARALTDMTKVPGGRVDSHSTESHDGHVATYPRALAAPSIKSRVRSSVLAPSRTLARLQLSRIRPSAEVRTLWTDANHHVVVAMAHVPELMCQKSYMQHVQRIYQGSDAASLGILGAYPSRAPDEMAADYPHRLLGAVRRAMQVVAELVEHEEDHGEGLRADKALVRDDLKCAEDSLQTAARGDPSSISGTIRGRKAGARSVSDFGSQWKQSSLDPSSNSCATLRLQ
jgi:hypothetical protein